MEIWVNIAIDSERAADRLLDGVESVMNMLAENPRAGRERPELADELRSFAVESYVLFYKPMSEGIELVRVRPGRMDIRSDDMA